MKTIGVILMVVGALGLIYGGVSYTTQDKVLDIGPVEVSKEEKHAIPLPPAFGAIALIGGIGLTAASRK